MAVGQGLAIGVVMIAGTYLGKRVVERLPARVFQTLVELVLVISGLQLLLTG